MPSRDAAPFGPPTCYCSSCDRSPERPARLERPLLTQLSPGSFSDVLAATREASEFLVPAGRPDEYMQAGAAFARELDPGVEISFWDSQRGSLSVSRTSPGIGSLQMRRQV